ncbi:MAG: 3-oxoacyl-ACP synthase III [Lentisphaeria bacterium]|nr:3-oxoacyl-ACP synthase III [Lentisphaeria bacterium]
MRYTDVCIETISYILPPRVVTSEMIETWLKPLYDRLKLPEGRLELMTGIHERRMWDPGTHPSEVSAQAGAKALEQAGLSPSDIGCLVHAAVSRDFVEPATSTAVHRLLGLPPSALNFDISNACLGVLTGIIVVANMIQVGQIDTGLIVAGENGGPLVTGTVERLNKDETLTRRTIKPEIASLTIGSAATAVILRRASLSQSGHQLLAATSLADTTNNHLCQGSADTAMDGSSVPIMHTDSHELLVRGIDLAARTWERAKGVLDWENGTPDTICGHQVGRAHSEQLCERLGLDSDKIFSTFEFLGNCGSASLPVTTAMAAEQGFLKKGHRLAMLGIGSGINSTMLGVRW